MLIGLDISTSCTGICLLNDDGSFNSIHHIELKKEKNFYKKIDMVLDFIDHIIELKSKVGDVVRFYVEAPLLHFKMKASMASVLALLQKFNACVCYGLYLKYGHEPKLISVISARKMLGISIPKKTKKKDSKLMVFNQVKAMNVIPEINWTYKKTGRPKDFCFDRCDAFVIARSAYEEENRCQKEKI